MRISDALVTTCRAFELQRVLAELVAQFLDMEWRRHAANSSSDWWRKSIQ
jgi:hypothetical protein